MPGCFCRGNGATGAAGQGPEHRQPPAKAWGPWWGWEGIRGSVRVGGEQVEVQCHGGRGPGTPSALWSLYSLHPAHCRARAAYSSSTLGARNKMRFTPRGRPAPSSAWSRMQPACLGRTQREGEGSGQGGGRVGTPNSPHPLGCLPSQAAANHSNTHPAASSKRGTRRKPSGQEGGGEPRILTWNLVRRPRS